MKLRVIINSSKYLKNWLKIFGFLIFISIILAFVQIILSNPWYKSDFLSFYLNTQTWTSHPERLYDITLQYRYQLHLMGKDNIYFYPFIYLPVFLIPVRILLFLLPQQIYFGIVVFQLIIFVLCLFTLFRLFHLSLIHNMLLLSILLSFTPVFVALFSTQSSVYLLFVYIFILKFFREKKYFWTGFATSFLLYKSQFLILPSLILLLSKNKPEVKGLLFGIFLNILTNIILLKGNFSQFIMTNIWYITEFESKIEQTNLMVSFQSVLSIFLFFLSRPVIYYISIITAVLILGIISVFLIKNKILVLNPTMGVIFLVLGSLLSGMHVHTHDAVLLVIPLIYLYSITINKVLKYSILMWVYLSFFVTSPFFPNKIYLLQPMAIITLLIWFFRINYLKNNQLE